MEKMDAVAVATVRPWEAAGMDPADWAVSEGYMVGKGINCTALVLPTDVLKFVHEQYHQTSAETDVMFYLTVEQHRPELLPHVARTRQVGIFTVQERIVPFAHLTYEQRCKWEDLTEEEQAARMWPVVKLAILTGVFDMHSENIGFRADDVDLMTPVVFDFSGRREYRDSWRNRHSVGWVLAQTCLPSDLTENETLLTMLEEFVINELGWPRD